MLRFWVNCETGLRGKDSTKKLDTFSRCWLEPKRCTGSNHSKGPHANLIKLDFHFRKSAGRFCTIQRGFSALLVFLIRCKQFEEKACCQHLGNYIGYEPQYSHNCVWSKDQYCTFCGHARTCQPLGLRVSSRLCETWRFGCWGPGMDWGSRVLYVLSSLKMFATVRWGIPW